MYRITENFKSEEGEGTLDLQPGDVMPFSEKGEGACFFWWGEGGILGVHVRRVACGALRYSVCGMVVMVAMPWLIWCFIDRLCLYLTFPLIVFVD